MKTLILLILVAISITNTAPMDLILFDAQEYPEAQCLDGSQAGFYWQAGSGDGSNKLMLYFEGGGACLGPDHVTMMTSCYQRSFTDLGSSQKWSQQVDGYGVLQDSEKHNPRFYNWNKMFIKYCGGTVHQGYLTDPVSWVGKKLYIKGLKASLAAFNYASKHYGLTSSQTTDVLLTGTSAGGLGTFFFADYVMNLVSTSTKYWAAPDSGFFINYYTENDKNFMVSCIQTLLNMSDLSYILPSGCPLINDTEQRYKCVLPQYFAQYIKSDLFIIMSEYDEFNISVFLGVECTQHGSMQNCNNNKQELLQDFRLSMIEDLEYVIDNKSNANAWSIACIRHGFFQTTSVYNDGHFEIPANSGNTAQEAMYQWMYSSPQDRVNSIDKFKWPLNIPCNGVDYNSNTISATN